MYELGLGLDLGLEGPGLGLEGPGLGLEGPGLGLVGPGLVNISDRFIGQKGIRSSARIDMLVIISHIMVGLINKNPSNVEI